MSDLVKELHAIRASYTAVYVSPYIAELVHRAADRIAWLEGENKRLLDKAQMLQRAIDRLCGQNKRLEKENAELKSAIKAPVDDIHAEVLEGYE